MVKRIERGTKLAKEVIKSVLKLLVSPPDFDHLDLFFMGNTTLTNFFDEMLSFSKCFEQPPIGLLKFKVPMKT